MKIAVPIREDRITDIKRRLKAVDRAADFVEIWLDTIPPEKYSEIIELAHLSVIAVCKASNERGKFKGSEKERIESLLTAAHAGAKFVDCGLHTSPALITYLRKNLPKRTKLIISHHDWKETSSIGALEKIVARAEKRGADIIKIATSVRSWADNVTLFELTRRAAARGIKIIVVGMGDKGRLSRLGCPLLGSYLTYVASTPKQATAPGQITLREWNEWRNK
ncbi:type I 3-dehydroquinate dehydratase [Candidatus Peregrinibacteria bacterium CG11_big_fil_rev_8_21_14_0_20_46_8]|nr:MAG: type I 3-dehydroquinate dehydratase [Candidatus Peregrinibacteria bacterium CG11_big_fil_rev_8_21_14_0_20_46_8]